jgi:hypothetical protein
MSTALRTAFRLGYEISPIILTNGIAKLIPGGMLPIVALTEAPSLVSGLLQGNGLSALTNVDQYFAHWMPLAGSTLIKNEIGSYPFANQIIAANAIIKQPNNISMLMVCPAQRTGGYATKLATISALKKTLDYHHQSGGTYTVVTPSYIYTGCILTAMTDATGGESNQVQTAWRFDFVQPLITLEDAGSFSSFMQSLEGGLPIVGNPTWSGLLGAII